MRYPVRNGSVINVLSLPTFVVPQAGMMPTNSGETSGTGVHPTTISDCHSVPSSPEDSAGSDNATTLQETSCPPTQGVGELTKSAPIYYQTIMGQLSSDVHVGEPLLRVSPLVIVPHGLPITRQTKVAPSKVATNYFQTKGFSPLPHPPPIHTNPDHHPQLSDVFIHSVLDDAVDVVHQIWVLSETGGSLSWATVHSPHTTARPGQPGLVLSFNASGDGIPTPTWVKPDTARRHGRLPRLYQALPQPHNSVVVL